MLPEALGNLVEDFALLSSKQRMEYLIELGKEADMTDDPLSPVPGCSSPANADVIGDDTLELRFYSSSLVVRGYFQVFDAAITGQHRAEVKQHLRDWIQTFLEETNLQASMAPARQNAFSSILEHIESQLNTSK